MILLIAPHTQSTYGELNDLSAVEPPIWAAMLHGTLTKASYLVDIIDQHAENLTHPQVVRQIQSIKPDLVVLVVYGHQPSASSQTMQAAHELLEVMREEGLHYPVVLVGGHPSALPREVLKDERYPNLMVAKGEGLNPIKDLINDVPKAQIPGLYWREGYFIHEPWRHDKKAENLDLTYPQIDWSSLPMKKYRAHNWHVLDNPSSINSYAAIYTSLGCPFKCSFCCINAPFDSNSFRYWSPEQTVRQIEILNKEYGIENLKIADEMFVLKELHFMRIAQLIPKHKIKMNIWAYARVDTVRGKYLETLKKAGVNWLALGIESGSQYVRNGVTKGRFRLNDIYDTVEKIKSEGIHVIGNFIFGLPDDTHETMRETLLMAKELNCEFANFYSAMAYPGSELYRQTAKRDLPRSYLGYSQHAFETTPLPTKTLTAAEVLKFRDEAHESYFTDPGYLNLVKKKFGERGLNLISKMNSKKIKRKLYDSGEVPAA